jgi:hypothetical protein
MLPEYPPNEPACVLLEEETIETIVQDLLAQGVKPEDIVMPGSGADAILFVADDFDAPTSDFSDYM